MFTFPISFLKGHLNIPSTTWLASKPRNPVLSRETHQQLFLAFISFTAAVVNGDMPRPRLSVIEKKKEVAGESLLQPIMSVICPQIEGRRDKEKHSDTTHSVESTFMDLCVFVFMCVSNYQQHVTTIFLGCKVTGHHCSFSSSSFITLPNPANISCRCAVWHNNGPTQSWTDVFHIRTHAHAGYVM